MFVPIVENTAGPKWQIRNLWPLLLAGDNSAPYLVRFELISRDCYHNNGLNTDNITAQ